MISLSRKFIFLHPPKTAGNSIQKLLLPFSDDQMVLSGHQDGIDRFNVAGKLTPHKHALLADYATNLGENLKNFQVVVSARHPFARAVSFYFSPHRWLHQNQDGYVVNTPVWDEMTFRQLVKSIIPMTGFLSLQDGIRKPDHIIRFESLQSDLAAVFDALQLPHEGDFPHANATAAHSTQIAEILSNESLRDFVEDHFWADMAFFNYPQFVFNG